MRIALAPPFAGIGGDALLKRGCVLRGRMSIAQLPGLADFPELARSKMVAADPLATATASAVRLVVMKSDVAFVKAAAYAKS